MAFGKDWLNQCAWDLLSASFEYGLYPYCRKKELQRLGFRHTGDIIISILFGAEVPKEAWQALRTEIREGRVPLEKAIKLTLPHGGKDVLYLKHFRRRLAV